MTNSSKLRNSFGKLKQAGLLAGLNKILFILKKREQYGSWIATSYSSSGLNNSARFVVDMLAECGFESKLVTVSDNNDIDREVKLFNPAIVVLEALWVVPEKFDILTKKYPEVKWNVRLHSEVPFLSNEGVAFDWILKYLKYPNVTISTNSLKSLADLRRLVSRNENIHGDVEKLIKYTPNYYPEKFETSFKKVQNTEVHIGCFGAIRPFKNHVVQAMAAIEYAASNKKYLKFYVNGTRTEQAGINCLKNLRSLFYHATNCELIELPWLSHNEFKELLHDKIDLALQCSFTETFNIVTADAVSSNVPVVVSNEIDWVSSMVQANFSDISDIVKKMNRATKYAFVLNKQNQKQLKKYLKKSKFAWIDFIQTSKKTGLLH